MSDKERLEEIKEHVKKIESIIYGEWRQPPELADFLIESLYYDDHVDWLINRIEELEAQLFIYCDDHVDWLINRIEELEEHVKDLKIMLKVLGRQTERYKQALEFYADENNYREHDLKGIVPPRPITFKPILHDYGSIARQALESDEN